MDAKDIVEEFRNLCASAKMAYELYWHLFGQDERRIPLYEAIAPLTFYDLSQIVGQHVVLQFTKLTDPAKIGRNENLTTKYVLETIQWPDEVRDQLTRVEERLTDFRKLIEPARSKRLAHTDFHAQMIDRASLGAFPEGADRQFLRDLQEFVTIAMAHVDPGGHASLNIGGSTDVYLLVRALEKATLYDQCTICDERTRTVAILDLEQRDD